jgi:hypothetical protein
MALKYLVYCLMLMGKKSSGKSSVKKSLDAPVEIGCI